MISLLLDVRYPLAHRFARQPWSAEGIDSPLLPRGHARGENTHTEAPAPALAPPTAPTGCGAVWNGERPVACVATTKNIRPPAGTASPQRADRFRPGRARRLGITRCTIVARRSSHCCPRSMRVSLGSPAISCRANWRRPRRLAGARSSATHSSRYRLRAAAGSRSEPSRRTHHIAVMPPPACPVRPSIRCRASSCSSSAISASPSRRACGTCRSSVSRDLGSCLPVAHPVQFGGGEPARQLGQERFGQSVRRLCCHDHAPAVRSRAAALRRLACAARRAILVLTAPSSVSQ